MKRSRRVAKEGWGTAEGIGVDGVTPATLESGKRSLSSGKRKDIAENNECAP